LVFVLSCLREAGPPKLSTGDALGLPAEVAGAGRPSGPLKVVFSGPRGVVSEAARISVVFDRPVQELETAGESAPPFSITPALSGRFRWVGSRAAEFAPDGAGLPGATRIVVEIPAGSTALDGTKLAATHRFEFETPRPKVVRSEPYTGATGLTPDTHLRLELNQIVTRESLERAAVLTAETPKGRARIGFEVTLPDAKQPKVLLIKPKRPLPVNANIELKIAASLKGTEGPLEAGAPQSVSFRTYGPLRVDGIECDRPDRGAPCAPRSPHLSLSFTNPIQPNQLEGKLRITPDPKLRPFAGGGRGTEPTSYVPLYGEFLAGTTYSIEIAAGIIDQYGQPLAAPFRGQVRFGDHLPRVEIGTDGRNFAPGALAIPVWSRNVPSFELFTAALKPSDVLSFQALAHAQRPEQLAWLSQLKQVSARTVSPGVPKNSTHRLLLESEKALPQARGLLAIGARYQPSNDDYGVPDAVKLVSLSDLGLTAKISRHGSLVWVTRRSTNAPVADAEVALLVEGAAERKYTTNSDGLAQIPAADFAPELEQYEDATRAIVLARHGADVVYHPVSEFVPPWNLDVPTDFSGRLGDYGVTFSDRGIYRPGDEAHIKGIVRRAVPTGNTMPGEKSLDVSLQSPSGDVLATERVLLTAHGTFATKLRLPLSAELGTHRVIAADAKSKQAVSEVGLEVAEYRAVEMRIEAQGDRPSYVRGDSARLEVSASYLFGAPLAGAELSLSVSRQPTWFTVPDSGGFVTDADLLYASRDRTPSYGELRRETRKLPESGRIAWEEKLALLGQRGPELLRLDAEVTDVSRQSVATSTSAIVHPASFYVGLKQDGSSFVNAPSKLEPRAVAFDISGRRLSGKRVVLELVERRYTLAREQQGEEFRTVSRTVDKVLERCEVTTAAEPVSCALNVPSAGYYVVVARSKPESGGRVAEAALGVYAVGAGEPVWRDNDRKSLELVLDKKSYRVGERARVLVKSPYAEAEALITVERSGVYRSERRTLRGSAPSFEVPVTQELAPNAFVGVQLLPKRGGKAAPLDPAGYRIGYAPLAIESDAQRLNVVITPSARDARPGATIEVKVRVHSARGAAAAGSEVTLYAVDEGVLSLIDYRTPDPLLTFSAARPLQVATLESRDAAGKLVLDALGLGRDKGAEGGGGGGLELRRDFRQTAYFNPRLISNEKGEAKASFELPESLTTYRLMAVVVGQGDTYGFAQDRVTTSKPLMARPALPRFLRAGDELEAAVVVSKKGMPSGRVKVAAELEGLMPKAPLPQEVDVPENGSVEVRFPAVAAAPGTAKIRFHVSAGAEKDGVAVERRIGLPIALESTAIYGETHGAIAERLGDLSKARPDAGELSVSLSSTALVGVDETARELIDYPYSCTEQLASRLLPLAALGELSRSLDFALPKDAARRAEATLAEMLTRQTGEGGFAMWPDQLQASDWVSPYAALVLARASKAGLRVPKAALAQARRYLKQLLDRPRYERWELPVAALAVDALAELGSPDPGHVNRLFVQRHEMPLFGKALLLHAALRSKLASDVPRELQRELEAALHVQAGRALVVENLGDDYALMLDSRARTQAMVLRALASTGEHPLLSSLARGLLGMRRRGSFQNTQEAAWALLALDAYRTREAERTMRLQARVRLGEKSLGGANFTRESARAERFDVPLSALLTGGKPPLVFEMEGSGTLFYEARLRYARRELPSAPLDAGFFIEKGMQSVRPEALARAVRSVASTVPGELSAAGLVLVDLTLVTPTPREYVVLDDPLPAGLEAVDQNLATTAAWLDLPITGGELGSESCEECEDPRDARAHGRGYVATEVRREVRDDRVLFFVDRMPAGIFHYRYLARATTPGKFVLPPTRAFEMYTPEVFGRTRALELSVR
jgi:hypothetical protein